MTKRQIIKIPPDDMSPLSGLNTRTPDAIYTYRTPDGAEIWMRSFPTHIAPLSGLKIMNRFCVLICVALDLLMSPAMACAATADQCQEQSNARWKSGEALKNAGKCREAIAMYEECIAVENTCAKPRSTRIAVAVNQAGYCYGQIGQLDQAISYYEKALHIFRTITTSAQRRFC